MEVIGTLMLTTALAGVAGILAGLLIIFLMQYAPSAGNEKEKRSKYEVQYE